MIVTLSGRVDSLNAPEFLELYQQAAQKEKPEKIFIQAENLSYISSAGLRVLLIMIKEVGEGNLKVSGASEEVQSIFEQTGFDSLFD